MRSRIGKAIWAVPAVVVLLSIFGPSAIAQNANSAASPLIGTWQVKVTLLICGTVNPLGPPPFHSLLTFARGGTLAEDTINPSFQPGQRGPGQGVWETTPLQNVFNARSVAFINLATPGPPPLEIGTQVINQTITYDDQSDTWTAAANISFFDVNGNVYRPQACATATATRF